LTVEIETPQGLARAEVRSVDEPRAALVLGHGAGGGVTAPDLTAATKAALSVEIAVALIEQPYRVAGRRTPPRPPVLDAAWISVVEQLRAGALASLPIVAGGRSMGGRVACRTAGQTGALGVLCLAFPLEPPRRADRPRQSRLDELDGVSVPTLVVQGESDPFGIPPSGPSREVVIVPGDHGLKGDLEAVAHAVREWLLGKVQGVARIGA
jgi:predicted alpha/beta-hydrolase family hydrolase